MTERLRRHIFHGFSLSFHTVTLTLLSLLPSITAASPRNEIGFAFHFLYLYKTIPTILGLGGGGFFLSFFSFF